MAIESRRVIVPGNNVATQIYANVGVGNSRIILNVSGGGIVLGGPTVSAANGFRPRADVSSPVVEMKPGDEVWGLASSPTVVSILIQT